MILTIPMQPGTVLANVRYYWIVGGIAQSTLSSGVTQPDNTFPLFVFTVIPPDNADEIIVFDATEPRNWNVGQYKNALAAEGPPPPIVPPPVSVPPFFPPTLRTVTFRSVVDSILRRHQINPQGDRFNYDTLRAVTEHINTRVRTAWNFWEWPQLTMLQHRAFRTVWIDTLQFQRVNSESVPDELYYPADGNYYRVKAAAPADPPVGTLPTNTTYFETFALVDRYILLEQANQTPMGEVIAVFDTDPRVSQYHYAHKIPFHPTEREVTTVCVGTGAMVWVVFRLPYSVFTGVPWVQGKAYIRGDLVYYPPSGECYKALAGTLVSDPPPVSNVTWARVPLPEIFSSYVTAGSYADGLSETDAQEKDPVVLQVRNTKAQIANAEADTYLQQEVDRLVVEGQVYRYGKFSPVEWWRAA